jgi:hypothetical protein
VRLFNGGRYARRKIQREPSARDSLPLKSSTIVPKQDNTKEVRVHDGGAKTPREISAAMHLVTLFH